MKKIECPSCGEKLNVGRKNPMTCKNCSSRFNVVTVGIPVKVGGIPDQDLERLFDEYSRVGQSFMREFSRRFRKFNVIPFPKKSSEQGICACCGEEKKLVVESKISKERYCLKCFEDYVFGSAVRKEFLPLVKQSSPLPLKTFIDSAFIKAQQMFKAWLKNNWYQLMKFNVLREFEKCKEKGFEREPEDEPEEIKRIREEWRTSRRLMSVFRFFHFYWLGYDDRLGVSRKRPTRKNRKKRRERLRKLSEAFEEPLPSPKKVKAIEKLNRKLEQIEAELKSAELKLEKATKTASAEKLKERIKELRARRSAIKQTIRSSEGETKVAKIAELKLVESELKEAIKTLQRRMTKKLKERVKKLKARRSAIRRKIRVIRGEMKVTKIAEMVARPICEGCENLREYPWGLECQLDRKFKAGRPDKIPEFPKTEIQYPKGMYKFERVEKLWKLELPVWEKGKRRIALAMGTEWIEKRYDAEEILSDNKKYPDLVKKEEKGEYFLLIPKTEVIPIRDEGWVHVIAYTPKTTCVLSVNGNRRKIKFFRHGQIISIKEYYQNQRQKATRGYFKKERRKESKKINLILHKETKQILEYLEKMPGKVILINFQKRLYRREEINRRELNRKLKHWLDSVFRVLLQYKLELAGLEVEEIKFFTAELAKCPYCEAEVGGTWQDLVIARRKYSLKCSGCGKDTNANLAMAMIVLKGLENRKK